MPAQRTLMLPDGLLLSVLVSYGVHPRSLRVCRRWYRLIRQQRRLERARWLARFILGSDAPEQRLAAAAGIETATPDTGTTSYRWRHPGPPAYVRECWPCFPASFITMVYERSAVLQGFLRVSDVFEVYARLLCLFEPANDGDVIPPLKQLERIQADWGSWDDHRSRPRLAWTAGTRGSYGVLEILLSEGAPRSAIRRFTRSNPFWGASGFLMFSLFEALHTRSSFAFTELLRTTSAEACTSAVLGLIDQLQYETGYVVFTRRREEDVSAKTLAWLWDKGPHLVPVSKPWPLYRRVCRAVARRLPNLLRLLVHWGVQLDPDGHDLPRKLAARSSLPRTGLIHPTLRCPTPSRPVVPDGRL